MRVLNFFFIINILFQDTVIGIYALAMLAEQITSSSTDMTVTFNYLNGESKAINVNRQNLMILQKHEVTIYLY